jgi:hypothetical protein
VILESEEPEILPSDSISQINVPNSTVSYSPNQDMDDVEESSEDARRPPQRAYSSYDREQSNPPHHVGVPHSPEQEEHRTLPSALPPPSSYISTANSTSRRRSNDDREQRRAADLSVKKHYNVKDDTQSNVNRHNFQMMENASVASLQTRSVVGSRDSSVSIGMKRHK